MRHSVNVLRALSLVVPLALTAFARVAAAQEPPPPPPPEQPALPPPPAQPEPGTQPPPPPAEPGPHHAGPHEPGPHHPGMEHHPMHHPMMDAAGMEHAEKHREKIAEKLAWLEKFKVSGYIQPQLLWQWFDENSSPNGVPQPAGIGPNYVIAKADGTTTNPDYFRLRRTRLKTEFEPTKYARFVMEIDPSLAGGTAAGTGTIARNVEAVGIVHWPGGIGTTEFGLGIFKIPFGYEVLQSDADRPFIERSWSEQNLTPGEFDTGLRAYTSLLDKKLNIQLALVNGQVQGESRFAVLPDLNKGKDFVGRVNYNFGPVDIGFSGMAGQGQIVDATALKFKQFSRWAINGEVGFHHTFSKQIGQTKLFAEVTRGQNYDRGTKYAFGLPSFPVDVVNGSVSDWDELGYFIRLEQDFTEWFTLGLRYDYYTPNSADGNNARDTWAGVGVIHFTKGLQWMIEYNHVTDNVHAIGKNAPSKHIDVLSNVLQVRF